MKTGSARKKKVSDLLIISFRLKPEESAFFYSFDPLNDDKVFTPSSTRAMRVILNKLGYENHEGKPDKKKSK